MLRTVGALLIAACVVGCDDRGIEPQVNETSEPRVQIETGQDGAEIVAPGVRVETGDGGTDVVAPGVNVDVRPDGTEVNAPGADVDVER